MSSVAKARGDVGAVGGRRVDAAEHVADLRRRTPASIAPSRSSAFHTGWSSGGEIGHREAAAVRGSSPRIAGTAAGTIAAGDAHPLDLPAVALDRRPPVGGDLELGQRALDAADAAGQVDPVDVRRHAAGQRRQHDGLVSAHYRHAPQPAVQASRRVGRGGVRWSGGGTSTGRGMEIGMTILRHAGIANTALTPEARRNPDRRSRRRPDARASAREERDDDSLRLQHQDAQRPAGREHLDHGGHRRTTPSAGCARCTTTARSSTASTQTVPRRVDTLDVEASSASSAAARRCRDALPRNDRGAADAVQSALTSTEAPAPTSSSNSAS